MSFTKRAEFLALAVLAIFATSLALPPVNAASATQWSFIGLESVSGTAGDGVLASALLFDTGRQTGSIGIAGELRQGAIHVDAAAIGALRTITTAPPLPCGSSGEVGFQGVLTSGSFKGQNILAYGCVGTDVPVGLDIYTYDAAGHRVDTLHGSGSGTVLSQKGRLAGGLVAAKALPGSGTAGSGTIYVAEAVGLTSDSKVLGGGAFVGTLSSDVTGVWLTKHIDGPNSCTVVGTGVANAGSFAGQPVTSSVSLSTCPPTSSGPQAVEYTFVVGFSDSPSFTGHAPGTLQPNGNIWNGL